MSSNVVLSTYPGSFRLPNNVRLWLLRDRGAHHLFNFGPVEESNFALCQVERFIFDEDVEYAGTYDDNWGWYNSSIVYLSEDLLFCGIKPSLKSGEKYRDDPDLVEAIRRFDPEDFAIIDAPENFKVETGRDGEFLLNRQSIIPNERD